MKNPIDKQIASSSNAIFGGWKDLLQSKGIKKQGEFLVSGERAVAETLDRFPRLVRSLIVRNEDPLPLSLIERAREMTLANDPRFSVISLTKPLFDEIDVSGTHSPILVVKTPEIPTARLESSPEGLELLLALGDPSNVGAVLRSAAAFGVSKVVLLRECASPFHPKAIRAASAATLATPLVQGPSIKDLPTLATEGKLHGPVLALDMMGSDISTFAWPSSSRLLLGEEGQGVPTSSKFQFLSIPMASGVESLNATIAASIALFASQRSRGN